MADNIQVTQGSGTVIATELISGSTIAHHQRIKMVIGAVDVDNGDVSASNPMPVIVSSGTFGTITITGSTSILSMPSITGSTTIVSMPSITGSVTVLGGTAGTASTNVITVQGIANGVAQLITGSTTILGTVTITGSVSVINSITGSTTIVSMPAVTGSVTVISSPAVTGSVSVINTVNTNGNVAHAGANSGNPDYSGAQAISHGTNPIAVTSGQRTRLYSNVHGIPFVMAGHPNVVTIEAAYTTSQTNTAIVPSSSSVIIVTQAQAICSAANSVNVGFRLGFGASSVPTTGTGVLLTHPGVLALSGSGVSRGDGSGIIGMSAVNQGLYVTCDAATSGAIRFLVSYYTVDS